MTSITLLRQNYLNRLLGTTDAKTQPWTTADRDAFLTDALAQCWPDIGNRVTSSVSTSDSSDSVTLPGAFAVGLGEVIISRIDILYTAGGITRKVGKVTSWQYRDEGTIRIKPALPTLSGLSLEFVGFVPFQLTGGDLPVRLERVIAYRAAALAYGALAGQLANSERQQGLDQGSIVDYPTAVGLSAYWERRYFEQIEKDPYAVSIGIRRARR